MSVKSVLYIDKKRREVLYVPFFCVVINKKEPEVILDLVKLKRRQIDWEKGRTTVEEIIGYSEVEQEDTDAIVELCFQNKITEARSYCIDIFDQIFNKEYNID